MATFPLFNQPASGAALNENAALIARERQKSLTLRAWIGSGLFFMALPGTLLGFSNLMAISAHHGLGNLPAAWMEGHGHAQMFGWIGSFILGIGFYSQPAHGRSVLRVPLSCYVLWTSGVAMRWFANIYGWHWRTLLPISAGFELLAVVLFLYAASHHKLPESNDGNETKAPMELWMISVLIGTAGLASAVIFNFVECIRIGDGEWPTVISSLARSEVSGFAWLGICRAGGVGILCALVVDLSRDLEAEFSLVSGGFVVGHHWRSLWGFRLTQACDVSACAWLRHDWDCSALHRTAPWPTQNSGRPSELSGLHPPGLCMADCCGINERLGRIDGCAWRHLGRIASCAHGRIRGDDGLRDRAVHPAAFRGHPANLQHAPDASEPGMSSDGMPAACPL